MAGWTAVGLVLWLGAGAAGFYLPGVNAPTYNVGFELDVYADKLTSPSNKIPYDYFSLPFCHQREGIRQQHLNLGEILLGNRDERTNYRFLLNVDEECAYACATQLTSKQMKVLKKKIADNYELHLSVDDLPAVTRFEMDGVEYSMMGIPLGYERDNEFFLYNHISFTVYVHKAEASVEDLSIAEVTELYRVVGFDALPSSMGLPAAALEPAADAQEWFKNHCRNSTDHEEYKLDFEAPSGQVLILSYDVQFKPSNLQWATRWDALLANTTPQGTGRSRWYLINSIAIMLLLSILVAGIMFQTVHLDFSRIMALDEERTEEETGWKQIAGDVFRPPKYRGALAVMCGTGVQLAVLTLVTLACACQGFFAPWARGRIVSALILFWTLTSSICGYVSARTYAGLGGTQKKMVTIGSAFFFSGLIFSVFFSTNFMLLAAHSSAAVNFLTLVRLLVLWLFISVPLNAVGAFLGYRRKTSEPPTAVSSAPRPVPNYSPVPPIALAAVGGIIPFGVVFIGLVFILDSLWHNAYFTMFGFLFAIFAIMLVTCAEVSIVLTYLILVKEDWRWHWMAFVSSASSGTYVLLYSFYFILRSSGLRGMHFSSFFLFAGYTLLLSTSFAMLTGSVGYLATSAVVQRMYRTGRLE